MAEWKWSKPGDVWSGLRRGRRLAAKQFLAMYSVYIVCVEYACGEGASLMLKGNKLGGGEEYQFEALQCDDAHALTRYSSKNFGDASRIKKENGIPDKTTAGEYTVVQYTPDKTFKAIYCEKKITALTAVCGAFSHSKLVEPLTVLKPVQITINECRDIASSQILTTEDGRTLRVVMGTKLAYKYAASGSLTLSEGNVACEGGEFKIDGKKHENIIELITVDFKIAKIEVNEVDGRLRTPDGVLPRSCAIMYEGCSLSDMTLVMDAGVVDQCPYKEVR